MSVWLISGCSGVARRIAAVLACLCVLPAFAATDIRTAAQVASEPKFVTIEQGGKKTVGGLCVDIMRAIERVAPEIRFVGEQSWQPLRRIEAQIASGNMDAVCGLLHGAAREGKFNYLEPPLFPVNYYLIARADDDVRVESWDDVRKLGDQGVILVIHGFGIINRLNEIGGLRIDSGAYDSRSNLEKLLAGRGRFYIHRSPGIAGEIRRAGMQGKVRILPTPLHSESFYMVVSKTLPPDVAATMSKAIATLEKSGELKSILEKWNDY